MASTLFDVEIRWMFSNWLFISLASRKSQLSNLFHFFVRFPLESSEKRMSGHKTTGRLPAFSFSVCRWCKTSSSPSCRWYFSRSWSRVNNCIVVVYTIPLSTTWNAIILSWEWQRERERANLIEPCHFAKKLTKLILTDHKIALGTTVQDATLPLVPGTESFVILPYICCNHFPKMYK